MFELSCFQVSPSYHPLCDSLIFTPLPSSSSQVVVTVNHSSTVTTNDMFQIVMRGRSSLGNIADNRRCEKVIELSLLNSHAPLVTLEVLSGTKMNPSSKLKILGRVDMASSGKMKWTVNDASINLASVSLSPVTESLPSSPMNSPHVLSLVLVGNSLPPQSSFIFTLSCTLVNGYSSSSSVIITTNSPPFGGMLEVSPAEGIMLQTLFSMIGLGWIDEDLPLSYQFGYVGISDSTSNSPSSNLIVFR